MRMYKVFSLFLSFGLLTSHLQAQIDVPVFGKQQLINGYGKTLQGEVIPYVSLYENFAKNALLTRCTDGKKTIEWETDPMPSDLTGNYAYFTWIAAHSTGTSSGTRHFDFFINDALAFTITTHPKNYPSFWSFSGSDSTKLVFAQMKKDWVGDAHGMVYLRVPVSKYPKCKPLKLKIVGQKQDCNDWMMTFAYAFEEKIDIQPMPFLVKGKGGGKQPVQFTVLHFGDPEKLKITINNKHKETFAVNNGFNVFEVLLPSVQKEIPLRIEAKLGKYLSIDSILQQKPVNFREINLVHHAHTDIGYSHIQEEVIIIHKNNISRALRLIEQTKNFPEGSRFVWNIESAWAIEHFLESADERERQSFFDAVRNRQIGVSALFANVLTGLATPEEMQWLVDYACTLRAQENISVNTAMMSDIPGISWSMVKVLSNNGIRYFSNGPNYIESMPDKGDRIGSTLAELGNKAFWWKSPDGQDSILLWTCGKGYSAWHGMGEGGVFEKGTEKIAAYLNELDAAAYPYDMVQWRYNIVSDNGPTDSTITSFVKQWNEKYASPQLVISEVGTMFERFEKQYGKQLPTLRGDFTPYWEDGAYSTAREEAENRLLSEKIVQLEKLAGQEKLDIHKDWLYKAKKNVVLFHEHTWGAWCSVSKPDDTFSTHQWDYKKKFLDSAQYHVQLMESTLFKALKKSGQFTVVNTLDWERSGLVETAYPASFKGTYVVDDNNQFFPVQRLFNGNLCFYAEKVPANGKKTFRFHAVENKAADFQTVSDLKADSLTGAIQYLSTQKSAWIASGDGPKLFQALYVPGRNPAVFSTTQTYGTQMLADGPNKQTLRLKCSMEGANYVVYDITRFTGSDDLHCAITIDKKAIREKESVHIALPFNLTDPVVRIGMDKGFYRPKVDQTPGANMDFFSVQRWIDVSSAGRGVTVSCPQGALFEIGEMVNEEQVNHGHKKWKNTYKDNATLFVYLMNNYWHTNYKADQEGVVKIDLYLRFHKEFNTTAAYRFGMESVRPLMVVSPKL